MNDNIKTRLIHDFQSGRDISDIATTYDISRQHIYKIIASEKNAKTLRLARDISIAQEKRYKHEKKIKRYVEEDIEHTKKVLSLEQSLIAHLSKKEK